MSRKAVYCLDFDGVLCNSIDECLVTGYNAYFRKEINTPLQVHRDFRDYFYKYRYFVRPAGEYYVLFHAYEAGIELDKQSFDRLKGAMAPELDAYSNNFYECRYLLKKKDINHWLSLHKIYSQCKKFLNESNTSFYIITNKDLDSVKKLASYHGFSDKIIKIYSKEISLEKKKLFERLFEEYYIDPLIHQISFVDDNEDNLEEVQDLSLNLYHAFWGYCVGSKKFSAIRNLSELIS